MIDWDRVDELRDEIGADDLAEVLQMFLDEVDEKFAELLASQSPQPLAEDMHFLKSSALNIGFAKLAELCSAAEIAAASALDGVDIKALQTCYQLSCADLRARENLNVA